MRPTAIFIILLSAVFFSMQVAAQDVVMVSLLPAVEVDRGAIVLGDVVEFDGIGSELRGVLESIDLGPAPLAGESRYIGNDYIRLRLQQSYPQGAFRIAGSEGVAVVRRTVVIHGEEIFRQVRRFIYDQTGAAENDIVVEAGRLPQDIPVTASEPAIVVNAPSGQSLRGACLLTARIVAADKELARVTVPVVVRWMADVVVASGTISRGEIIRSGDIHIARHDVTNLGVAPVGDPEFVTGKRARTTIKVNQPITERMIEQPPLVKRRDIVTLLYETGAVRICAKVEVREDGCLGEVVRVRNPQSRKEFSARVMSDTIVQAML
jgi:flagella basal body P-ring formation protein FlgA